MIFWSSGVRSRMVSRTACSGRRVVEHLAKDEGELRLAGGVGLRGVSKASTSTANRTGPYKPCAKRRTVARRVPVVMSLHGGGLAGRHATSVLPDVARLVRPARHSAVTELRRNSERQARGFACREARTTGQYWGLGTDWPVFHAELCHWEVVDVRRCQARANPDRRGRNEAVRLVKRDTAVGEFTPPCAGTDPFRYAQWREPQRIAQTSSYGFLFRAKTSPDLLHLDRTEPRLSAYAPQSGQPRGRGTTP
jgi:hypothetical protein